MSKIADRNQVIFIGRRKDVGVTHIERFVTHSLRIGAFRTDFIFKLAKNEPREQGEHYFGVRVALKLRSFSPIGVLEGTEERFDETEYYLPEDEDMLDPISTIPRTRLVCAGRHYGEYVIARWAERRRCMKSSPNRYETRAYDHRSANPRSNALLARLCTDTMAPYLLGSPRELHISPFRINIG